MYTNYYLIPIFDSLISIKDYDNNFISLAGYTEKYFPRLNKLEEKRIGAIWSGDGTASLTEQQKFIISLIENEKKELAMKKDIPLFILVVLDKDGKVYEVVTKHEIYYDYDYLLSVRECSKRVFLEKNNSSYALCIQKFFNRKNFQLIEFPIQKVLKK